MSDPSHIERAFPDSFIWGVGTSSYQIEGGWNADGKGPSIWDTFCHRRPSPIVDGSDGDVACNSYEHWQQDIQCLKQLNVSHYRFSISWPRVLPTGLADSVNEAGVKYYNGIIDELIAINVVPVVTLYHWDLPQALQDRGGWLNREIVTWFKDYADFCFRTFGDRVRYWTTINEPWITAWFAHGDGKFAPGITGQENWAPYLLAYHQLLAHGTTYRLYHKLYNQQKNGYVCIAISWTWSDPATDSQEDVQAADSHPIFSKEGGWPSVIEKLIDRKSRQEGRTQSRLPLFSEEEKLMIKGSADFFALNYYHASLCRDAPPVSNAYCDYSTGQYVGTRALDTNTVQWVPADWQKHGGPTSWCTHNPLALRKILNLIKQEYENPPVIITENGCPSERKDGLNDDNRVRYIHDHLSQAWKAMKDGCNLAGYMHWSLMDNFEWVHGYSMQFGLYQVDFRNRQLPRTARRSAEYLAEIYKTNVIQNMPEPYKRERAQSGLQG